MEAGGLELRGQVSPVNVAKALGKGCVPFERHHSGGSGTLRKEVRKDIAAAHEDLQLLLGEAIARECIPEGRFFFLGGGCGRRACICGCGCRFMAARFHADLL